MNKFRLYFHFVVVGFSNSYLIGTEEGGDAILIDPGVMDNGLISLIEENGFRIKHVLITHGHESHTGGLTTLLKIYPATVYASDPSVCDGAVHTIDETAHLDCSGIPVHAISVPGHSSDSLIFRIGQMLFTGDVLGAGVIGSTPNSYAQALLLNGIRNKLLCFEDDQVFPGHGPPTTIRTEKAFNPYLLEE